MTENKRFTLEETDWSYRIRDNGAIMKIPKIVDLLNEQHETITKQQERIHSLMKYNLECDDKVKETLQSFSNRDLLDIERIFLNNLCDELGVDLE